MIVIGIAAIVLSFSGPLYSLLSDVRWVLGAACAATAAPALIASWVRGRTIGALESYPADPGYGQRLFGRGMTVVLAFLASGHAALLLATAWLDVCRMIPIVGAWLVVPEIIATTPFLLAVILVWVAIYPADRAIREIALETYLFRGRPIRPVWSLAQYLTYNLRHQVLFVLVPLLFVLIARELVEHYEQQLRNTLGIPYGPDLLLGASILLVAVFAPVMLRYIWTTRRLPDGPLRDRLTALCARLKLRYREILVWHSGGMLVNAAVMGLLAPFRYVLITDGMIEQMDDRKIEAVFGHEAGHIKKHHILFFLCFGLISGCLVTVASIRLPQLERTLYEIAVVVGGGLLVFKWGVCFGWVSRNFERQADVYGVRTLALTGAVPLAATADSPTPNPLTGRLSPEAAELFADTLYQVAHLNGIPPEARSWRHGSIASRSRALQSLAQDASAAARFERRIAFIKLAIFVTALGAVLWSASEMRLWGALMQLVIR